MPRVLLVFLCAGALVFGNGISTAAPDHRSVGVVPVARSGRSDLPAAHAIHLGYGRVLTVRPDGWVIEKTATGKVYALSFCGMGFLQYEKTVEAFVQLQDAVRGGHHAEVAALLGYPLRWNHVEAGSVRQAQLLEPTTLLSRYAAVFTPATVRSLLHADPREIFCTADRGVMIGDGVVWGWRGAGAQGDKFRVRIVNTGG